MNSYLKYTPFIYLVFAAFFTYDGAIKITSGESGYALSFIIAAVCIFMFFFRRGFVKRMQDRNRKP